MADHGNNHSIVEALIMASPDPIPARKITEVVDETTPAGVGKIVADLNDRYLGVGSAYRIREVSGGYQFYITPEYSGYVEELFTRRRKMRLTRAALETLAIVAYRQPVTKTEIEHIRGVSSDGVLHNLLEKDMITVKGRATTVGKPLQYGTADEFLKFFGLNRLEDLPKMTEIEELVAVTEPKNQTELTLESAGSEAAEDVKLNIADSTFDPESRLVDADETESAGRPDDDMDDEGEEAEEWTADSEIEPEETFQSGGNGNGESSEVVVDMETGGQVT